MSFKENNYFYKASHLKEWPAEFSTTGTWTEHSDRTVSLIQRILIHALYAALGINPREEREILNSINNTLSKDSDKFLHSTELLLVKILQSINAINLPQIGYLEILKDICRVGMGRPSWKWTYKWFTVPASVLAELMVSGLRDGILEINMQINLYKNQTRSSLLSDFSLAIIHGMGLILQICANTIAFFTHWFTWGSIITQINNLLSELSPEPPPSQEPYKEPLNFYGFYIDLKKDNTKLELSNISEEMDNPQITIPQLLDMCHDHDNKSRLIIHLINQDETPGNDFAKLIRFFSQYKDYFTHNIDVITRTKLLDMIGIENLIATGNTLYADNPPYKNIFLEDAYKRIHNNTKYTREQKINLLRDIFNNINDLETARQIYVTIKSPTFLKPIEVLDLLVLGKNFTLGEKNKLPDIPLKEAFTEDGLKYIFNQFSETEIKKYNFNSIFPYLLLCTPANSAWNYLNFSAIKILTCIFLKPKLQQEKSAFIDMVRYQQLTQLPPFILILPRMSELCNVFLNSDINKIPEINESIAKIKTLQKQGAADFANDFIKLIENITDENTVNDSIANFVKTNCDIEINQLAYLQREKLLNFFKHNIKSLAYILSQPEGLTQLMSLLGTLADGCGANIGTHMQLATYSLIFKDNIALRNLYICFNESIVVPFFNNERYYEGSDIPVDFLGSNPSGNDPFKNADIAELIINPAGLVAALASQYCDRSGKSKGNPWENDIGQLITGAPPTPWVNCCLHAFLDTEFDTEDPDFNTKSAELAAYLVLEQLYPSILLHPLLEEFNDTYSNYAKALRNLICSLPHSILLIEVFAEYSKALSTLVSTLLKGSYRSPIINSDIYGLGCIQRDPSAQELKQSHAVMVP